MPLHVGANGKVLLAALPAEEREAVPAASVAEGPPMSAADVEVLRHELQETARLGYSITEGERVPGSRSMAAPVWTGRGDAIALLASGPESRFTHEAAAAGRQLFLDLHGDRGAAVEVRLHQVRDAKLLGPLPEAEIRVGIKMLHVDDDQRGLLGMVS